jgi:hypothetical protein
MIFLQDRRGMQEKKRKEKKTELEKPTGIYAQNYPFE